MAQGKLKGASNYHDQWNTPFLSWFKVLLTKMMNHKLHGKTSPLFFAPHPSMPHPENLNLNQKFHCIYNPIYFVRSSLAIYSHRPCSSPICKIILLKLLARHVLYKNISWLTALLAHCYQWASPTWYLAHTLYALSTSVMNDWKESWLAEQAQNYL